MAASLGIETNWFLLSATVPLISFLSLMPISLDGWGVREFFLSVYLLSFLGINAQHSLLVGISFGVLSTSVAALGFLPHISPTLLTFLTRSTFQHRTKGARQSRDLFGNFRLHFALPPMKSILKYQNF